MSTRVVYVHGLWLNGWESVLLRRRLSRTDVAARRAAFLVLFGQRGRRRECRALVEFLSAFAADTLHLVGS